jgi:hypothetical protein
MAISRSKMNRQLREGGGIMNVARREQFGLGSKLKKFVRKVIPNEISKVAVKAAPFVSQSRSCATYVSCNLTTSIS